MTIFLQCQFSYQDLFEFLGITVFLLEQIFSAIFNFTIKIVLHEKKLWGPRPDIEDQLQTFRSHIPSLIDGFPARQKQEKLPVPPSTLL